MSKRVEKGAKSLRLTTEILERREMLSGVPFSEAIPIGETPTIGGYYRPVVGDLNRDGLNDLIVRKTDADGRAHTAWRINQGDGEFGEEFEFQSPSFSITEFLDVDGDGDLDLYGRRDSDSVWFENTIDEGGSFHEAANVISDRSLEASGDFNNDGQLDFVTIDTTSIFVGDPESPGTVSRTLTIDIGWLRNTGAGFVAESIVTLEDQQSHLRAVHLLDLDSDRDLDLLMLGRDSAVFLRNGNEAASSTGDTPIFGEPETLDWRPGDLDGRLSWNRWQVADIDEDGDGDLVQLSFNSIYWAENDGGSLKYPAVIELPRGLIFHDYAYNADMDGDGKSQPVFRTGRQYAWFEDLGAGNSATFSHYVDGRYVAGDIDGNNDIDFLEVSGSNIRWYDSLTEDAAARNIQLSEIEDGDGLMAIDFDGDGDIDAVLQSRDSLVWFENLGQGEFGSIQEITNGIESSQWLLKDFDGDNLHDLITWEWAEDSRDGRETLLHRNQGSGQLGEPTSLPAWSGFMDIEGDGDLDIYRIEAGQVAVDVNDNGSFVSNLHVLFVENEFQTVDIDGDGDLDVFGFADTHAAWYENVGNGEYSRHAVVDAEESGDPLTVTRYSDVLLGDFDGDGDLDLLLEDEHRILDFSISQQSTSKLFEFTGGQYVAVNAIQAPRYSDIELVDLDRDGLNDFVAIEHDEIQWFENLGDLQFQTARSISVEFGDTVFADVDGDQKADLVTIGGERLVWQQNQLEGQLPDPPSSVLIDQIFAAIRSGEYDQQQDWNSDGVVSKLDVVYYLEEVSDSQFGDVNLDGKLGFADFLAVSSNFGMKNATWLDGDVDGDGEVGFADFLQLFEALLSSQGLPV